MIYELDTQTGVAQAADAGIGGPDIWVDPRDPVGTFRIGHQRHSAVEIYVPGFDDGDWHPVEESGWWVRLKSWGKVEAEYRI